MLLFGGDVMLGRGCARKIMQGIDPFTGIRALLARSVFAAANLECTISPHEQLLTTKKYLFLAPPRSASLLREAGFRAVSLANNHALDFGEDGLRRCAQSLTNAKVAPVGTGISVDIYTPAIFELGPGRKLALLALSDLPAGPDDQALRGHAHVDAAGESQRARLHTAIEDARTKADTVACMVHWGTENTNIVTDRQRELARWLIDQGVDVIAGSHPHCLQPLDFYHGRPIAYSLGNLVFDGAPTVASWNRGALLQIYLTPNGKVQSAGLIRVSLQDGMPRSQPALPEAIARK
jgi:poly-gamma-glutamate synthesis protein (capsule biosynthesis protein)